LTIERKRDALGGFVIRSDSKILVALKRNDGYFVSVMPISPHLEKLFRW
jgi:hypothetical protein